MGPKSLRCMEKPIPTPKACLLSKDKAYAYCTCKKSKDMPFCDGTHRALKEDIAPLLFKVPGDTKAFLCTCGNSNNKPYCDGSH